jgi:toxin CptA
VNEQWETQVSLRNLLSFPRVSPGADALRYSGMLRVILKPSRRLAAVLIAAHTAAAFTLVPLALPAWAKAGLALLVAASLGYALYRHAWLRGAGSVTAIEILEHDRVAVETRSGVRHEARVLGTTYVSPGLCVVNLRVEGRLCARHAVILSDRVDAETFRRLRVWLRWGYRQEG